MIWIAMKAFSLAFAAVFAVVIVAVVTADAVDRKLRPR